MIRKSSFVAASLLVLFLLFPVWSSGADPMIKDILITPSSDRVLLYAKVIDCFTKDMETAVVAGVPITFTTLINLYQERSYWYDNKIASITVEHEIRYDIMKRIFSVTKTGSQAPATFADFESAKAAMADLSGIAIASLKDLTEDQVYYIRLKAKLDKVRLPLHMEYVFFFVSLWDFETGWETKKFVYKK